MLNGNKNSRKGPATAGQRTNSKFFYAVMFRKEFSVFFTSVDPLRYCVKFFLLLCVFVSLWETRTNAQQNTDNAYTRPLKEVLADIEKKYGIKIKYADSMVVNKTVPYADWRYRNDVEITLDNVLKPLDMKVKKEKDKVYKLSYYEYY